MLSKNMQAFLDTIAFSELGADLLARSDNGYDVIVGSTADRPILFRSYVDHPRKLVSMTIKGQAVKSTAAGRYQILARYWDVYKRQLGLPDFGPDSQDAVALQLIRECRAGAAIEAGRVAEALKLCKSRWASLPGAGYNQHENPVELLVAAYTMAGGNYRA